MSDRVAAILTNYNMPERTDAIVEAVNARSHWPVDWYVVDNGSDLVAPSRYTNVWISENIQTTGGWLEGITAARSSGREYLGYWLLITSGELPPGKGDPLEPMAQWLIDDANAVGVHPALTPDSTTHWRHLISRGCAGPRRTWMIDNIAALWRASWFDEIGGFDPGLAYGWGVDVETCWKARDQGRSLWVHEGSCWKKVTDIGYEMDRMGMTADQRRVLAGQNMRNILAKRYGALWWDRMLNEGVEDDWR